MDLQYETISGDGLSCEGKVPMKKQRFLRKGSFHMTRNQGKVPLVLDFFKERFLLFWTFSRKGSL